MAKGSDRRVPPLVWGLGVGVLLGAVLLVLVGLPARRNAARDARLADELGKTFVGMERWAMDGETIEQAVADHDAEVDRRWHRLFPDEKGKDVLFLDLARVADISGVNDFFLAEKDDGLGSTDELANSDTQNGDAPPTDGMPVEDAGPTVEVSSFKVRTRFEADLQAIARFMSGLESVERAVKVQEILIQASGRQLMVEMEMEFYVSKEA